MIESILAEHKWYTTRWGDGHGGHGWKCSCGVQDWGTGDENPERYKRYPDAAEASLAAARHVGYALREHLVSTPVVERAAYVMYLDRPLELDQEGGDDWSILPDEWREEWREGARAALEGALAAQSDHTNGGPDA